ncbi:hypothetical protein LXL04_026208 [Taraxacum kok-saghyz]
MEEKYEPVKDGFGNFEVARLVRDKKTKEVFAVIYIDRGEKIDEKVQKEIINHKLLRHPNIVRFKEVLLTQKRLAIVMEYAHGGELFRNIRSRGRFSEDEARFLFQQLISGVNYCHSMGICHRDLKLENNLLDGSPSPRLKIFDFGHSKSGLLEPQAKSRGTPAYIAPEVLSRKEYDGKITDVWACGVTLYVMLVGAYPFEDPEDSRNFRESMERIINVQYSIPDDVCVSVDCRHLLSHIFLANPDKVSLFFISCFLFLVSYFLMMTLTSITEIYELLLKRITIAEIKKHPWFMKNMPKDLVEGEKTNYENASFDQSLQSVDEVNHIIQMAKVPGEGSTTRDGREEIGGSMDPDDDDDDNDDDDFDLQNEIDYSAQM